MLKKTVALVLVFILCFSVGVNAMTLNIPKEEYYENMAYSNAKLIEENCDFLYKLIFIGVIENFEFDKELTQDIILDIVKKAFNIKKISDKATFSTNQELVKSLCEILNIQPEEGIDYIRRHLDYGLIGKDYQPYYQAFASLGYINDKATLLRPNKPVTYKSLLEILLGLDNEIYTANSVKVISGNVKRINYVNTTKTITIETDDYEFDIPFKNGRKTAYLKDDNITFSGDLRIGDKVDMLVNANNEVVFVENSANKLGAIPNVEGIYKAKVYLYDYVKGSIIFNELQKFNGADFVKMEGKYTEFKVSDTALLYGYNRKTNGYYINRDFLDINAYFITDTNLKGETEIIYLNVVN